MSPDGITGTGPRGRVVRRDVEPLLGGPRHHATHDAQRLSAPESAGGGIPHFYVKRTVVVDQLLDLLRDVNEWTPVPISLGDCLLRAIALAHVRVPAVNAIWSSGAPRLVDTVDIALAVGSGQGRAAPVLRGADKLNLSTISSTVRALVLSADEGRLGNDDVDGGAITVVDLTDSTIDQLFAIVDPPRSSVLTAGGATPTARVVNGDVTPVTAIDLVLSVDHRVIDRTAAVEWMTAVVGAVENPLQLVV